jgi:hypothetical protein
LTSRWLSCVVRPDGGRRRRGARSTSTIRSIFSRMLVESARV